MNKLRVFFMILLETMFLSFVGGPLGLLLGYYTIEYLGMKGVDLSNYSEGLKEYGYDSILYPYVDPDSYFQIALGVVITGLVAAIYPAYQAVSLKPVEALQKI